MEAFNLSTRNGFDIPGIRICRIAPVEVTPAGKAAPRARLPNGEMASDFSYYFKSILSDLDACYWLLDVSEGFRWLTEGGAFAQRILELLDSGPEDEERSSPVLPVEHFHHEPRLISEIAPYVRDDWNSLYGFAQLPADPACVVALWTKSEQSSEFLKRADLIFENWDGAFWTFYTNNAALVERFRLDMEREPGVKVEAESFQETRAKCAGGGIIEGIVSAMRRGLHWPRKPVT